jgi:thioredoxin-like negative regulator of GroEL
LTPRLEKAVAAVQGVKLAKLNIDVEADIAGQLRVDMLPTLFLIYEVGPLLSPPKTQHHH